MNDRYTYQLDGAIVFSDRELETMTYTYYGIPMIATFTPHPRLNTLVSTVHFSFVVHCFYDITLLHVMCMYVYTALPTLQVRTYIDILFTSII
jgi:hypothetical protein